MDYTFGKSLILSKQTDIDELFAKGKRVRNSKYTILYRQVPMTDVPFQVLISIPKRKIKKAVDRNYLKRCIKEVLRKNKVLLIEKENSNQKSLLFAIIYNTHDKLDYEKVEKHLIDLIHKIPVLK